MFVKLAYFACVSHEGISPTAHCNEFFPASTAPLSRWELKVKLVIFIGGLAIAS